MSVSRKKFQLPSVGKLDLNIDLARLRAECDAMNSKFVDVKTANPMLCMNHEELVKDVYDNFEQINLTTPSEILPFEASIKERLRRREEHLYNVPTDDYTGSYIESIVTQCKAPASRVRITKLSPMKVIPYHVDYDVSYAVRCIIPIYTSTSVLNYFKRDGKVETYLLKPGHAYFLNIAYPHSVVNLGKDPRIALMFSLDGQDDLENLSNTITSI